MINLEFTFVFELDIVLILFLKEVCIFQECNLRKKTVKLIMHLTLRENLLIHSKTLLYYSSSCFKVASLLPSFAQCTHSPVASLSFAASGPQGEKLKSALQAQHWLYFIRYVLHSRASCKGRLFLHLPNLNKAWGRWKEKVFVPACNPLCSYHSRFFAQRGKKRYVLSYFGGGSKMQWRMTNTAIQGKGLSYDTHNRFRSPFLKRNV